MKSTFALFCACLLAAPVLAAPGVMLRDETLRATPAADAAAVGRVAKGATVDIVARQGGWTRISGGGRSGWVRILSVRTAAPATGLGDVLGAVEAGTARRDPGKVVAVAGVRGLDEEELKLARFNAAELQRLSAYASSRAEAEAYAREAGLRPAKLAYLPNPKRQSKQPKQNGSAFPWNEGGL